MTGDGALVLDAAGIPFRELNAKIRAAVSAGRRRLRLRNVSGQYYIGDGLRGDVTLTIEGVPGNDLGAFMDGPTVVVMNNAQDNVGNTMNAGKIVVHGNAGDVLGYGMRGGKIFVRGNVGYRVGIHMKGYRDRVPLLVVGGGTGDFLGEYMAGGVLIVLGLGHTGPTAPVGDYLGAGMHGGVLYVRGTVDGGAVGKGLGVSTAGGDDREILARTVGEFCREFDLAPEEILSKEFSRIVPVSQRPYGNLYAY